MIIGLCGAAGSGKSLAAKILQVSLNANVHPFAGPLKKMILALGVEPRHVYGTPADKAAPLAIFGGKSAREAMQALGTEWGRKCIAENFWIEAWRATLPAGVVIVDDIRFANEVAAVANLGGIVVRITRPGVAPVAAHESENFAALSPTHELVNDKCPVIFERRLIELVQPYLARSAAE